MSGVWLPGVSTLFLGSTSETDSNNNIAIGHGKQSVRDNTYKSERYSDQDIAIKEEFPQITQSVVHELIQGCG